MNRCGVSRFGLRRSGVLALVLAALIVAASCGSVDDVTMREGTCLPSWAKVQGRREADPPTVNCDDDHRYEVYAVGTLDQGVMAGGQWPGDDEVDAAARQLCYEEFAPNVGFDPREMGDEIRVLYITPTEDSWRRFSDLEVECLLVFTADRAGRVAQPGGTTAEI